MPNGVYDLVVIGGGVNGCGIARDAAGRGLSVALFEKNDLASGTSSSSTKLIHGGLRYLEHYEFRLVRESLKEREVLLAMAPHISWPLRFVLPHLEGLRPAWLIRLGLFIYDHLGGRKLLPGCKTLDLRRDPAGIPLKSEMVRGFEYSDCWVDDARLVVLTAMDGAAHGAEINVRTEVVSAHRKKKQWEITVRNCRTGNQKTILAKALVNAAGPWVGEVLSKRLGANSKSHVRLVKGSHIVLKKLFDHDRAYIFQNADARIIFAIPYEQDYTLVGTTDVDYTGDPAEAAATDEEIAYLCKAAGEYFEAPVRPEDVVWTYSGIRPLFDSGEKSAQKATRDYVLELDRHNDGPVLLNVFGGKITTFRRLSEEALDKLEGDVKPPRGRWTGGTKLPGGDFPVEQMKALEMALLSEYASLDPEIVSRMARTYGTLTRSVLAEVKKTEDLGENFGGGLFQKEVEYLLKNEWAMTSDDILWRRTKLGLRLSASEVDNLDKWLEANVTAGMAD